jgi:hypothetical protein
MYLTVHENQSPVDGKNNQALNAVHTRHTWTMGNVQHSIDKTDAMQLLKIIKFSKLLIWNIG